MKIDSVEYKLKRLVEAKKQQTQEFYDFETFYSLTFMKKQYKLIDDKINQLLRSES